MKEKIRKKYLNFEKAFGKLVFLKEKYFEKKEIWQDIRDSFIQRFEFTLELSWKVQKIILEDEGFESNSPKDTISKSFSFGMIKNYEIWFDMINSRNLTSHTYNEDLAQEISEKIEKKYLQEFENLKNFIKQKYDF